jgi:hypothetical protein
MYNADMDPIALQAYRQHWQAVEEVEKQEACNESMETRWQQLNTLAGLASALGIFQADDDEEELVRSRWNRLRAAYQ